jgi:hypothetical protein
MTLIVPACKILEVLELRSLEAKRAKAEAMMVGESAGSGSVAE